MHYPLATYLARLSRQPMLLRGDHFAALGALVIAERRALPARADLDDSEGAPADWVPPWETRERVTLHPAGVAVIPIDGVIAKGFDALTAWCYGFWRLEAVEAAIALVSARADVHTIIFDFNTPGGYVTGVEETGILISRLGATKLTLAYTGTLCASAGYWLASQCARIISTRSATVGSIGTYAAYYDYTKYLEAEGVELKLFRAGDMKGLHVFGHKLTPEEETFLQASIDAVNATFIAAVLSGRGAVAESSMQGQWFTGAEALSLNLVDATVVTFAELLASVTPPQPTTLLA